MKPNQTKVDNQCDCPFYKRNCSINLVKDLGSKQFPSLPFCVNVSCWLNQTPQMLLSSNPGILCTDGLKSNHMKPSGGCQWHYYDHIGQSTSLTNYWVIPKYLCHSLNLLYIMSPMCSVQYECITMTSLKQVIVWCIAIFITRDQRVLILNNRHNFEHCLGFISMHVRNHDQTKIFECYKLHNLPTLKFSFKLLV